MSEDDDARRFASSTTVTRDLLDEPVIVWNKVKGGIEVEENKVKSGGWEGVSWCCDDYEPRLTCMDPDNRVLIVLFCHSIGGPKCRSVL